MIEQTAHSARGPSLARFVDENHDELVARCRAKVATRTVPMPTETELEHGVPLFLKQLSRTLRGSEVILRTRATSDRVLIEVEDECGGLADGAADGLFRPFEQGAGDRSGVGLGLAICRRGVDALGGDVRVRDLPGKGCVFTVELPRHVELPRAVAP